METRHIPALRTATVSTVHNLGSCGEAAATFWIDVRLAANAIVRAEPMLGEFVNRRLLGHACLEDAIAHLLAHTLGGDALPQVEVHKLAKQALAEDPSIALAVRTDIAAVCERDPASDGPAEPLLFYKGVHALIAHRLAHWLWKRGRGSLARYLQSCTSERLGVDIHPAARLGRGILLDHANGVVIGETAVVEDNVSILHNVTLGGTGKASGDRHPKVRSGVLLGAGALVLGNVEIGQDAKVGAGSVVLKNVPPHMTVTGALARSVGTPTSLHPSRDMNHNIDEPT
jgi:serine O-acetyltransferase